MKWGRAKIKKAWGGPRRGRVKTTGGARKEHKRWRGQVVLKRVDVTGHLCKQWGEMFRKL